MVAQTKQHNFATDPPPEVIAKAAWNAGRESMKKRCIAVVKLYLEEGGEPLKRPVIQELKEL